VAFQSNFIPLDGVSLGCHCVAISGVSATFANSYHAANQGRNIAVLDETKEEPIKYIKDRHYDLWMGPIEEYQKVVKYLQDIKIKLKDFDTSIYSAIASRCSTYPLWVMSDVINYDAPARKTDLGRNTVYQIVGSTGDFAQYLVDNKIGYIMGTPIIQNPTHRTSKNYSLNRGWFWIPPDHLSRAVNVAEIHGEEKIPNKETWLDTVGPDIGILYNGDSADADRILKAVFNDGVFPEDKRFKREVAQEA